MTAGLLQRSCAGKQRGPMGTFTLFQAHHSHRHTARPRVQCLQQSWQMRLTSGWHCDLYSCLVSFVRLSSLYVYGFHMLRFSQTQIKNIWGKNCICTKHVKLLFFSFAPNNMVCVCSLYFILDKASAKKVYRRMYYVQVLHHFTEGARASQLTT